MVPFDHRKTSRRPIPTRARRTTGQSHDSLAGDATPRIWKSLALKPQFRGCKSYLIVIQYTLIRYYTDTTQGAERTGSPVISICSQCSPQPLFAARLIVPPTFFSIRLLLHTSFFLFFTLSFFLRRTLPRICVTFNCPLCFRDDYRRRAMNEISEYRSPGFPRGYQERS